jgi:serine/threonine-protein phosphatase 5
MSDNKAKAEQLKLQANNLFKENKFHEAIELYTDAIKLDQDNAILFANRSMTYIKIEQFGLGLDDASRAIELDPKYVKAYYRRGTCYLALGKYTEALNDLRRVTKIVPNDREAAEQYDRCRKEFEQYKAQLASEKEMLQNSAFKRVELEKLSDDGYTGPKFEAGAITEEFVKAMIEEFRLQRKIHKKYVYQILQLSKQILSELPTLVDITIPDEGKMTVCGDIHGQYYDLLNIFKLNGEPSPTNPYLFNGDFVDRGSFSCEVILTLLAYKCLYPNYFHLARGNHEARQQNRFYGFEGEVRVKYGELSYELFCEVFCYLPLAHVINNKVYVVHGGLFSQDGITLPQIRKIPRVCEPPIEGLMSDMLWADPQPQNGWGPSKRGVGKSFGPDVVQRFLKTNNLELVIRSHEVKDEGYEVEADGKLITVFSAPNYCDQIGNKGAFINFKAPAMKPEFVSYECVPHPNVPPMAYASPMLFGWGR